MIKVTMLARSLYPGRWRKPITSMLLTYPRFIHSEFMTHRVFSRNASSSRAVPIERMIREVEERPAMPVAWHKNIPGMQGGELLSRYEQTLAEDRWQLAMLDAVKHARELEKQGVHKQIVNRILEPFAHITVVVTATEWDNFFQLRLSPMAQPEIEVLAKKMKFLMDNIDPVRLDRDGLHAPFVDVPGMLDKNISIYDIAMASAARTARTSFLNHDGSEPLLHKDLRLAERLKNDWHASPFEHQAMPTLIPGWRSRNFRGWSQFRARVGL